MTTTLRTDGLNIQEFTVSSEQSNIRSAVLSPGYENTGHVLGVIMSETGQVRLYHFGESSEPASEISAGGVTAVGGLAFHPEIPEITVAPVAVSAIESYAFGLGRMRSLRVKAPSCVAYSRDGSILCAGTACGVVQLWDLAGGFSGDAFAFFSSCLKKEYIVELMFVQTARGFDNPEPHVDVCALTADGRAYLVSNRQPQSQSEQFLGDHGRIPIDWPCRSMALHPYYPLIAFGGDEGVVWTFDYKLNYLSMLKTQLSSPIRAIEFMPADKQLAVAGENEVQLWKLKEVVFSNLHNAGNRWSLVGKSTWKPLSLEHTIAPVGEGIAPRALLRCQNTLCVVWSKTA
jgi:WD40 repeat protein